MLHRIGGLLLTRVAGYWVLERAETHKGQLKKIGLVLGSLIIVISLVGVVAQVWCSGSWKNGYCPFGRMGKGSRPPAGLNMSIPEPTEQP